MLLHLYGDDSYRRNRAVREIIAQYQKKYPDGTVGTIDFNDEDALAKLAAFAAAPGLFAKSSLAVVRAPEEGGKELAKLLKTFAEVKHVTVLVVADKKLPKEFAVLYEKGVGPAKAEFETPEGIEFLKFLKADAAERELKVPDTVIAAIGAVYAGDTWGAVTEIQRVAGGGEIAQKGPAFDFIGLIRTIAGGTNVAQRLKALFLLFEYDEPAKVFNMVAAFAGGSAKVKMADYDIAIKSGKLEYGEALLEYVLTS